MLILVLSGVTTREPQTLGGKWSTQPYKQSVGVVLGYPICYLPLGDGSTVPFSLCLMVGTLSKGQRTYKSTNMYSISCSPKGRTLEIMSDNCSGYECIPSHTVTDRHHWLVQTQTEQTRHTRKAYVYRYKGNMMYTRAQRGAYLGSQSHGTSQLRCSVVQ